MGFRADGQERILEDVFGAKVILLKHGDRTHGQKELHWGNWLYTMELGEVRQKGGLLKDFDMLKRTPKPPEALLLSS